MVSRQAKTLPPSTRDRLHSSALEEFARRGFDGAKVDRIAARARVNKAMIYYHFASKAGLYQAVVTDVFQGVAEAVSRVAQSPDPPAVKIRQFIDAVAGQALTRPHFPALWLREMAEGGRHLNADVLRVMGQVLGALAAILEEGRRAGAVRAVPPFIAHLGIVGPILLFSASTAIRARVASVVPMASDGVTREALMAHVADATLAALKPVSRRRTPVSRRSRR